MAKVRLTAVIVTLVASTRRLSTQSEQVAEN